jgi:hypothetical protein
MKKAGKDYAFAKAYIEITNAEMRFADLMKEQKNPFHVKTIAYDLRNRTAALIKFFESMFKPELLASFKEELGQPEVTLQVDYITDMLLQLPKGIRDQMEKQIEAHHKIYCLKEYNQRHHGTE